MRFLRRISLLTILALLCAMVPASLAEDFAIDIEEEDFAEETVEEVDSLDLSDLMFEDEVSMPENNDMDLLDADLYEADGEEQAAPAVAANASSDFEIDEDGVLIQYTGFDKNVVIPSSVTEINEYAFQNVTTLETVTIPNSVTYIGDYAFSECEKLKSISIPSSVTEIGESAFYDCDSLKSVTLSKGIKCLESYIFSSCDMLENIVIPDSVTSIKSYAFSDCSNLESITIPSSVASIARNAFVDGSEIFVIRGVAGSYAEKYANGVGIPFNAPVVTFDEETEWDYDYDKDEEINCIYVYLNQSRTLKAVQKPSDLATTLKWSSSNNKIATVDQNGTVKGIAEGIVTITAATANGNGKAANLTVKVFCPEAESVTIEQKGPITLKAGEKYTLTAKVLPAGASQKVTWSTYDTDVVTVSKTGVVTAVSGGEATIWVETDNGYEDSIVIRVSPVPPTSVKLNRTKATVGVSDILVLSTSLLPKNATSDCTFTSSNKKVISVGLAFSDAAFLVAHKKGKATITVKTENGKKAKCVVTVKAAPKKVTLYKGSKKLKNKQTLTLKKGKTLKLKAKLPAKTAASLTWTSSKPTVATVDENGKITALKPGTTTITVKTHNKKTAKVKIKVK